MFNVMLSQLGALCEQEWVKFNVRFLTKKGNEEDCSPHGSQEDHQTISLMLLWFKMNVTWKDIIQDIWILKLWYVWEN